MSELIGDFFEKNMPTKGERLLVGTRVVGRGKTNPKAGVEGVIEQASGSGHGRRFTILFDGVREFRCNPMFDVCVCDIGPSSDSKFDSSGPRYCGKERPYQANADCLCFRRCWSDKHESMRPEMIEHTFGIFITLGSFHLLNKNNKSFGTNH